MGKCMDALSQQNVALKMQLMAKQVPISSSLPLPCNALQRRRTSNVSVCLQPMWLTQSRNQCLPMRNQKALDSIWQKR